MATHPETAALLRSFDRNGWIRQHISSARLAGRCESTLACRVVILTGLLRIAQADVSDITRADVIEFLGKPTLAPGTRGVYLAHIRTFFTWCVEEGLLENDPTHKIKGPRQRRGVPRPVSPGDLSAALLTARPTVRCWLLLGAFAGLRCFEMAQLRGEDIHLDAVTPTMTIHGKGGYIGTVPIHPGLAAELARWPREGWLFPHKTRPDEHVKAGSISAAVNLHFKELGIKATAHATRHLFATSAYRLSGHDLRMTQELLRHASPATTAIYTKVEPAESAAVVTRLAYGAYGRPA